MLAGTAGPIVYIFLGLILAVFGTVLALNPCFRSSWVRFAWRDASDKTVQRYGMYGWAVATLGVLMVISGAREPLDSAAEG